MLNIKNTYKVIGSTISTMNDIYKIDEVKENVSIVGLPAYQFKIHYAEKDRMVTLYKDSNWKSGNYELFIMGYHAATLEHIKISEVKDWKLFLEKVGMVMDKFKSYIIAHP